MIQINIQHLPADVAWTPTFVKVLCVFKFGKGVGGWGGFLLIPLMMIDTDTPSLLVPSSSLSKAWLHLIIIIDTTSTTFNTPPHHNLKFHTRPVLIMITISKTAPPSRSPPQGVRDGAYMAGTVLRRHATLVVCSLNDDYSCLRWLFPDLWVLAVQNDWIGYLGLIVKWAMLVPR